MNARHALLLLALPLHAAIGQVAQAGSQRDADLERRIETRREELHRFITPAVWLRVEGASRSMQERIRAGMAGDLVEYARKQVTARMGNLKPAQTDLLAFCILAHTARTLAHPRGQDSALVVDSKVDVLQSAELREALNKDSALMSAARQMLQWTEREGPEILLTVKGN
jgi:hypothetical protein